MTRPKFRKGDIVAWHSSGNCVLRLLSSKHGVTIDQPCAVGRLGDVHKLYGGGEVLLYRRRPARRRGRK